MVCLIVIKNSKMHVINFMCIFLYFGVVVIFLLISVVAYVFFEAYIKFMNKKKGSENILFSKLIRSVYLFLFMPLILVGFFEVKGGSYVDDIKLFYILILVMFLILIKNYIAFKKS